MNVYLIRNGKVEDDLYTGVYEFIKQTPSIYQFYIEDLAIEIDLKDEIRKLLNSDKKFHESVKFQSEMLYSISDYNKRSEIEQYSWEDLLSPCEKFRKKKNLSDNDVVIVLTDKGNHENWFTGFDKKGKRNYFVHTELWDYYFDGDLRYPIAYQVVTILLKQSLFPSTHELLNSFHDESRGCFMDFCKNKEEIMLKMRTADICTSCQAKIEKAHLPYLQIKYTFDIFESIRKQMLLKERYRITKLPGTILIKGRLKHVFIPELGMLKINLTPLERSVYLLFLNHLEGIRMSNISKFKEELSEIVMQLSKYDQLPTIHAGIDSLCQPESNSLSEKLARIRYKFNKVLGEDMANHYAINGPNGGLKKIGLLKENISFED